MDRPRLATRAAPAPVKIGRGDRVLIVGPTGSGKSTLATTWASTGAWRRSLILDPKLDDSALPRDRDGRLSALIAYGVDDAARALRAGAGRVVYRPRPDDFDDLPDRFDELVRIVYLGGGGRAIILHETADVAPSSGSRRYLSAAWRQGRSLGIPIVAITQRPVGVDRHALSEPAHVALFRVQHPEDRRLVAQLVGLESGRHLPAISRPFGFLSWSQGGRLVEHAPYPPLAPLRSAIAG